MNWGKHAACLVAASGWEGGKEGVAADNSCEDRFLFRGKRAERSRERGHGKRCRVYVYQTCCRGRSLVPCRKCSSPCCAPPPPSVLVRRSFFQPLTRVFVCLSTREQDPPGRLSRIAEPSRAPQKLPQLCWHCSHSWGRCGARPLTPESLLPPLSLLVTPLSLLP